MFSKYRSKLSISSSRNLETSNTASKTTHVASPSEARMNDALLPHLSISDLCSLLTGRIQSNLLDRIIRTTNRLINCKVSMLWRMRDSDQSTIHQSCEVYLEVKRYTSLVSMLLSQFEYNQCNKAWNQSSCTMLKGVMLYTVNPFACAIYSRIESVITTLLGKAIHNEVEKLFTGVPDIFLSSQGICPKWLLPSLSFSSKIHYSMDEQIGIQN